MDDWKRSSATLLATKYLDIMKYVSEHQTEYEEWKHDHCCVDSGGTLYRGSDRSAV